MMFKRKQGMVAILLLAILFWVVLGTLFVKLQSKRSQFNATIGETQLELMRGYSEGEKILFYIDQASKYSLYASAYDLASNGGFFSYKCNAYNGYGLWQNEAEGIEYCSPDYKNNLGKFANRRLESYFKKEVLGTGLPYDNYDFVFEESEPPKIHGIATMPISIKIKCGKDKTECGVYKIKPSFTHEITLPLGDYEAIKERLKKISEDCKKEQDFISNKNLEICINNKMGVYKSLEWKRMLKAEPVKGSEDRNFAFEVDSNKKLPLQSSNIIYKFAVFMPDNAPPPKIDGLSVSKKDKENEITLEWKENDALDVENYEVLSIYTKENIDCKDMAGYYGNLPMYITKSNPVVIANVDAKKDPITQKIILNVPIEPSQNYCFMVLAADELGNKIDKKEAEPVKITI